VIFIIKQTICFVIVLVVILTGKVAASHVMSTRAGSSHVTVGALGGRLGSLSRGTTGGTMSMLTRGVALWPERTATQQVAGIASRMGACCVCVCVCVCVRVCVCGGVSVWVCVCVGVRKHLSVLHQHSLFPPLSPHLRSTRSFFTCRAAVMCVASTRPRLPCIDTGSGWYTKPSPPPPPPPPAPPPPPGRRPPRRSPACAAPRMLNPSQLLQPRAT
jgi:hypothetical protein